MKLLSLPTLAAVALFSAVAVVPFHRPPGEERDDFAFEVRFSSTARGIVQLYFDRGAGLSEPESRRVVVPGGADVLGQRFPLPGGQYRKFRFDPAVGEGTSVIETARVVDAAGHVLRTFTPADFSPLQEIASFENDGGRVVARVPPGAMDPQLGLALQPPLVLGEARYARLRESVVRACLIFAGAVVVLLGFDRSPRLRAAVSRARDRAVRHPGAAVALVAAAGAVASSYPVVFLGRSFVSPNFSDGTTLLYGGFPTLPGTNDPTTERASGSDVGAMAWQHVPYAMVQHRALFEDGELPLWNRYNSCGTPLFAQGQSMFGDPIHFLVIAADGAAWAWDLKFLLAKWLFAAGLGLVVARATRHLPAALLTAATSTFIGFFLYRLNHPAFFSMCYAPWMLYCWLRIAQAPGWRQAAVWSAWLILANWTEMNSGTAKEAYMLLLTMNLTGAIVLACAPRPPAGKVAGFAVVAGAGVLFILISAPVWLSFLDALRTSYTTYNNAAALQIQPGVGLGLFDELFYRPLEVERRVLNPSANFLVLGGVLYVLATWRRAPRDPLKRAIALGALLPAALAFGVVPPRWIVRVPFVANIAHVDNTFSCALIVLLVVLAGFGFALAAERLRSDEARGDLGVATLLLLAPIAAYLGYFQAAHREPFGPGTVLTLVHVGQEIPLGGLVWLSLALLPAALLVLAWAVRLALRRPAFAPAGAIVALTCLGVLLWRFGQQGRIALDYYTFNPAPRVDFHAHSPAVDFIRQDRSGPWRAVGLENTFAPGWTVAYHIEGISGADAVMNQHYRELADAGGAERIWEWRLYTTPASLPRARRLYDMFGVRYYLAEPRLAPALRPMLPLATSADLDVYRSDTTWPRAFFTDRLAAYHDLGGLGGLIREGDGRPFASIEAGERAQAPQLPEDLAGRSVVPARDYRLTSNRTAFTVDAPGPGVVALQEAWLAHDFSVEVNGKPAALLRLNHAFKGVAIDAAGTYRVEFTYRPAHFGLGLRLFALGLVLLAGGLFLALRRPAGERVAAAPSPSG